MNEIERMALQQIRQIALTADTMLTETALKIHGDKEKLNPEKDVYPISSKMREIDYWVKAIIENQNKRN